MGRRAILLLILATALIMPGPGLGAEPENSDSAAQPKWIISSGTSSSLPAGSLLGLALALERGASSVWIDLVLSKDNQPVLLSDTRIDQLTDVATVYPDRSRPDGGFYSFDFTLEELRQVSLLPAALSRSHLPVTTLEDVLGYLDLVSADRAVPPTLICTLKQGWRHRQENKDLATAVLDALENYLATSGAASLIIGSYDPEELQQLAQQTGDRLIDSIGFMQLIGTNEGNEVQRLEFGVYQPYNYDLLFTRFGLKAVSGYANTIGLDPEAILDQSGQLSHPGFLEDAHILGLRVICTRIDSLSQWSPAPRPGSQALFEHLLFNLGFNGIVTSEDRAARGWLENFTQTGGTEQNSIIERLIDQLEKGDSESPDPAQSDTTR